MFKKIISFILVFAIFISCFGLSSFADYESVPLNLWDKYILDLSNHYDDWEIWAPFHDLKATMTTNTVCPDSDDNLHHADSFISSGSDNEGHYLNCQCSYCNDTFKYYSDDLEAQYQEAVTSSGFNGLSVSNTGYLYMYFTSVTNFVYWDGNYNRLCTSGNSMSNGRAFQPVSTQFAPVTGIYSIDSSSVGAISYSGFDTYGNIFSGSGVCSLINKSYSTATDFFYASSNSFSVNAGDPISVFIKLIQRSCSSMSANFTAPVIVRVSPTNPVSAPPNITNNITNVYSGNNTYNNIVNTTNNQYYDVSNDTYINMSSWNYDLSTRTYRIILDDGNGTEVEVEFGDDNITVTAGTTVNNYYYGYESCEPSPSHTHNWTSSVVSERTCTVPGITTYTCEECNETYTDVVPAIGHIWDDGVYHEPVTDSETGEITTPGYTTYTCTVCGVTQDVNDGSAPPGSAENEDIWWNNLLNWLAQFKTDLFNKLDNLNISEVHTTDITIEGDDFTFNEGDDENSFSFKQDFLAKFGIIKDLWDVGQYVVNIVSQDAANAYSFDINDALSIDTSTGVGEVTP